ncbi:hypothetical protein GOV09_05710 [Candidatus Woesearchaeota archaeon]|nr:hypothetical protein [Candidatus Woesearchaeota archaeon]
MELVRITPDREKARAIMKMVSSTLSMIAQLDISQFPSHATKEYYDVIRELISVIILLDGYKARGEGAHKKQIEYLDQHYKEIDKSEIVFTDELRVIRNRISYEGFFVKEGYIKRNKKVITNFIMKLKSIIQKKL